MMVKLPNWMLRSDLREARPRRPMEFESFARRAILAYLGIQGALAAILLIDFGALRVVQPVLSFCWSLVKRLLFFAVVSLAVATTADAATCTKGVDCYCDKVKGGSLNDTLYLLCEDFEQPELRLDVNVGSANGGPWYDDTQQPGNRGVSSWWAKEYGGFASGIDWTLGRPPSPQRGTPCNFSECTGGPTYHQTDLWGGNNQGAGLFVLTTGQFGLEIPSLVNPGSTADGVPGVFDGVASAAWRNGAGLGGGGGIHGETNAAFRSGARWGGRALRTFGITMAIAYASNSQASGIWAASWKHHEWHVAGTGAGGDGLFLFHNQGFRSEADPFFKMFTFSRAGLGLPNSDTQATCNAKWQAATNTAGTGPRVGNFDCDNGGTFQYSAASNYQRSVDWPDQTWACVRGHFQNMGTTNSSIRIWFIGPANVEKTIIDIGGMDLTGQGAANGYDRFIWDNYPNTNSSNPGNVPTTQTTFRYEDNIHIREGIPVSCGQIGYAGGSPPPPPPSNPPPSAPSAIWGHRGTDIGRGIQTSGGLIRGIVIAGSMIPLPIFIIGAVIVKRRQRGKKEAPLP